MLRFSGKGTYGWWRPAIFGLRVMDFGFQCKFFGKAKGGGGKWIHLQKACLASCFPNVDRSLQRIHPFESVCHCQVVFEGVCYLWFFFSVLKTLALIMW